VNVHSGVLHYLHNRHECSLLSLVPPASVIRQLIQHLLTRLAQVHKGKPNILLSHIFISLFFLNSYVCLITDC